MTDHDYHAEAFAAAARGWPVFPLKAGGKTPLTRDGFKSATTDVEQLRRWANTFPAVTGEWQQAIRVGY